jgi:hypothetical protein
MRKTLILLTLTVSFLSFSQIPDYSDLSRKDQLKLMNYYGFLIKKSGDTLIVKIKLDKRTNVPIINDNNELLLDYPKGLEKYAHIDRIALNMVDRFYFGIPRRFNIVKKYDTTHINLELIEEKKFSIYSRSQIETRDGTNITGTGFAGLPSQSYNVEIKTIYLSKGNGDLVHINGNNKEKREKLAKLLKSEIEPKKLNKIKTSYDKIIRLIKKLNLE